MQNWQKNRNYRKYKNADGTFSYIITVDGENVEVSAEVYRAYSKADRRERYCDEQEAGMMLSLEQLDEDGVSISLMAGQHPESAENAAMRKILGEQAIEALLTLDKEDRRLIKAVVIDGKPEKDYAEVIGVVQSTVHKRKKRILKKIFDLMELNPRKNGRGSEGE